MSSKFGQIRSGTTELAALEHLKIDVALFLVSQLWLYLGNSQVSVYRTICPLFLFFFEESLTKCESSSGRLLFLETGVRIDS